jgi:hypothetical protein
VIYKEDPPGELLEQGDVLKTSDALAGLLEKYHPYYANHPDNRFYVVLTQSCDLVPREGGCAARYISLAPVRPLTLILHREFDETLENVEKGSQPFATVRARTSIEQFLQRLLNNNEATFFYFERDHVRGIYEEMCGILSLPISFKLEHYKILLDAKLAGITDVFQAKLG